MAGRGLKLKALFYLSRAVFVLTAITHSSPHDLSTVHWNDLEHRKKETEEIMLINENYTNKEKKLQRMSEIHATGIKMDTYQQFFASIEFGT